ncbi:MAG: tRNA preQ1(34) S-adenosylmethionine ribosyltransferase-isomerase QueA [Chloroflexota bacterium]
MKTSLFEFDLPQALIAQQPAEPRDSSRLFVYHRKENRGEHRTFRDIREYLNPGDLLVANNSRVIPARLLGQKATGGRVEVFLLKSLGPERLVWECLVRGRNLKAGSTIQIPAEDTKWINATIQTINESGTRIISFSESVDKLGEIPLPPYITEFRGDLERYQTIYSRPEGSAAAPTAGLHFTPGLLTELRNRGVSLETVTLHVGLDTFKPVSAERVEDHVIHSEWATVSSETAKSINQTTLAGGRIIAVGTTSTRTLEYAATTAQGIAPYVSEACPWQRVSAFSGDVDLFIRPGYRFRAVDALLTNFHLPRSSLLMLVSAFLGQHQQEDLPERTTAALDAGREQLMAIYTEAIEKEYRFYSFGDAMLIL